MKPHKHKDLIIQWANGKEIEMYDPELETWFDVSTQPTWAKEIKYRVRPRDFKKDAWYPVIDEDGFKAIGIYQDGAFIIDGTEYDPENLHWIGEPIDITWP